MVNGDDSRKTNKYNCVDGADEDNPKGFVEPVFISNQAADNGIRNGKDQTEN